MYSTTTDFRVSCIFTSSIWPKLWLGGQAACTQGLQRGAKWSTRSAAAGERPLPPPERVGCWSSTCAVSLSVCLSVCPRLETLLLRRFCGAAGYGWDYPDSEYRDIPLCFPEFLCCRLLLMVLTDGSFRLSPAGTRHIQHVSKWMFIQMSHTSRAKHVEFSCFIGVHIMKG